MTASTSNSHFLDLPPVLLQHILHIGGKQTRQVCKTLLITYGALACGLRPRRYRDSTALNFALQQSRGCDSIPAIDLSFVSSRVNNTTLSLLVACYPKLSSVNLTDCLHLTDPGVANLAPLMHTLTHLDLSNCASLGEDLLQSLAHLSNLKALHFPDHSQTWSGNKLLLLRPLTHLTLLDIKPLERSQCSEQCIRTSPHTIFPLLATLTHLQHLSFSIKPWHTDLKSPRHIAHISRLSCLTALIIRASDDGESEQEMDIGALLSSLTTLTTLHRLVLPSTSESPLIHHSLHHLSSLTALQQLHISVSIEDTPTILQVLGPATSLTHLQLLFPCYLDFLFAPHLDLHHTYTYHTQLQHLQMDAFELTEGVASHLEDLTCLRCLYLKFTEFEHSRTPDWLSRLSLLEDLTLIRSETRSTRTLLSYDWLPALRHLTRFVLSDSAEATGASAELFAHVACAPGLVELQHDCCSGQLDPSFHQVSALTRLTSLKLTSYHSIPPGSLVYLPSCLQRLRLSCCDGVRDEDLRDLAHLGHLTLLALDTCNGLSGSGLTVCCGMSDLRELSIEGCTGVNEMQLRQLPALPLSVQNVWMYRCLAACITSKLLPLQLLNPGVKWHW